MNSRTQWLAGAFALLIPVYILFFTDWFRGTPIEIIASVRPVIPRKVDPKTLGGVCPVAFSLDGKYRLNSVKVVEAEPPPGKAPHIYWHLKCGWIKSWPVKSLVYGVGVPLMRPTPVTGGPEALKAGVKYRLIVQSGWRTGEVVFTTRELPATATGSGR